jgi:hypothetical protein
MIWLLLHPSPLFRQQLVSLVLQVELGVGEAESYDGEKAWSSINHSILSSDK